MNKTWLKSANLTGYKAEKVDRENGIIYGVAVNTVGEAKGHGVHLEQEFVENVVIYGNEKKQGLKARFGHPSMCSTALGTFVGRFKNFRVDGAVARADLFLSNSATVTPGGDLYEYVLNMAENESDMFGTSIVFSRGDSYRRNADGEKVFEDTAEFYELDSLVYATISTLHACDIVDDPAANPDGLFSSFNQETFAGQVSEFLDLHPQIYELYTARPEVLDLFFERYEQYKQERESMKDKPEELQESTASTDELEAPEEQVQAEEALEEVNEQAAEQSEESAEIEEALEAEVEEQVEAEEIEESAEIEEEETVESAEEPEEVAEEELAAEPSDLEKFQAFADKHGYEFARENYGKTEVEIAEVLLAAKDLEIEKLREKVAQKSAGSDPVVFNDEEIDPKKAELKAKAAKHAPILGESLAKFAAKASSAIK